MTPTEEILLNEMRYISSISTGQVKRTAKTALAIVAAMNAPLVTKTDSRPDSQACNPHPDAPHGFDRNASHSADRYVCACEGWIPDWSAA